MRIVQKVLILVFVFLTMQVSIFSFEFIDSHLSRYYSLLALQGEIQYPSLNIHTASYHQWDSEDLENHLWENYVTDSKMKTMDSNNASIALIDSSVNVSYNSNYPHGMNDGSQWQGKGLNSKVMGGFLLQWGGFSALAAPEFWYAQNQSFPIMDSAKDNDNEYGYFTNNIDLPQRFGDEQLFEFSWGESELRYDFKNLTLGIGNQSIWLGPSYKNAIILSNNAGGFPKIDLGLRKTKTAIGNIEGLLWWGRLTQSDFFIDPDDNPDRSSPHNLFTGLSLSYSPSVIPGLTIGVNRVAFSKWEDTNFPLLTMMFNPFMSTDLGDDETCQRASITLDWSLEEEGFNVYAEWARNDYSSGLRDNILLAPEHSQAYTIGGRQTLQAKDGFFVIQGEITQLIKSRTYQINGVNTNDFGGQTGFYSHHIIKQGHTHLGQSLGAAIGPGSDSQYLSLDYYHKNGMQGVYIQRISYNKDYIYGDPETDKKTDPYLLRLNVELLTGIKSLFLFGNYSLSIDTGLGYNINRNYEKENDMINIFLQAEIRI